MFTGIIQTRGTIESAETREGDQRLTIAAPALGAHQIGDSISVSGVCLTVIEHTPNGFATDVSRETLAHTTLGELRAGAPVNLELALTPETALGGHLVTGHVDAVCEVASRDADARSIRFRVETPPALARFIAAKGSVCLDGVSLTVNDVAENSFGVNIIPHTAAVTTLGDARPGTRLNLEVDLIARYVERLLHHGADPTHANT